jgi:TolA-binding protein
LKSVDPHPEELLDRERAGTLSAADRAELDAHTASCAACALERGLGADFAARGREVVDDDVAAARVASRTAAALGLEARPSARARGPRRFALRAAVALAAMLAVGGAAAAILAVSRDAPAPPEPAPVREEATAPVEAPPPATVATAEEAATEPAPSAEPRARASASASEAATAESLFARANQARRRGDDAEAIRLYRELQQRFPTSREAKVSRATLGQLLLDKGDSKKALSEFDGYLGDGGTGAVTEEALVGRASALQRMGKAAEERAAWQALLAKYPDSVHAPRARQRLSELR